MVAGDWVYRSSHRMIDKCRTGSSPEIVASVSMYYPLRMSQREGAKMEHRSQKILKYAGKWEISFERRFCVLFQILHIFGSGGVVVLILLLLGPHLCVLVFYS